MENIVIFIDMKKVIVQDCHGNLIETEELETRILTEEEVRERVCNTPKADVQALLAQGYREANEFFNTLENGSLQPRNTK